MPRRPARSVPVVLLCETAPWCEWLAGELDEPHPVAVDEGGLRALLTSLPDNGFDVVAHSAGSLLWLRHTATRPADLPRPARVALTALPADDTVPLDADAVRAAAEGTVLVGGTDDPDCPAGAAATYGVPLKIATTMIEDGGRLEASPWPALLDWCRRDNLAFY